jgi:uncharacterized BrkB/YihY/UPF0761 family membrane protein
MALVLRCGSGGRPPAGTREIKARRASSADQGQDRAFVDPPPGASRQLLPLTFLTGIVLGSSASILVVLALTVLIQLLLLAMGDVEPSRVELPGLVRLLVVFSAMTVVSALSFVALVKRHRWRWGGQIALWAAVAMFVLNLGWIRGA